MRASSRHTTSLSTTTGPPPTWTPRPLAGLLGGGSRVWVTRGGRAGWNDDLDGLAARAASTGSRGKGSGSKPDAGQAPPLATSPWKPDAGGDAVRGARTG